MRALSRQPDRRFVTIAEFRRELARARARLDETRPQMRVPVATLGPDESTLAVARPDPLLIQHAEQRTTWRLGVAIGAVALAAAGGIFALNMASSPEQPTMVPAGGATETATASPASAGVPPSSKASEKPRTGVERKATNPVAPPRTAADQTAQPPAAAATSPPVVDNPLVAQPANDDSDSSRREPPPKAAEPPSTTKPTAAGESPEQEIHEVLKKYAEAHATLNALALKSVQPYLTVDEMRGLTRTFLDLRSYKLDLTQPVITFVGDRARVDCTIARDIVPVTGDARRVVTRSIVQLEKTERGWIIASVTNLR
jgi:hypothetical protein